MRHAGYNGQIMRHAGCNGYEMRHAGCNGQVMRHAGCNGQEMRQAGHISVRMMVCLVHVCDDDTYRAHYYKDDTCWAH